MTYGDRCLQPSFPETKKHGGVIDGPSLARALPVHALAALIP